MKFFSVAQGARRTIWAVLGCSVVALWAVLTPRTQSAQAIVNVSSVSQLQSAVANLTSGVTIRLAPGRYALTQELTISNGVRNVALVGATGNRDDVVIVGRGMNTSGVNIPIKVANAQDVRIADLSVGEAFFHPIQLQGEQGADRVHISNVRLFDAGQQFLKSTVSFQAPNGVDDVIVENSLIEYTVIGPAHGYTNGIDVHHGANWIIRRNVFRNIHVPAGAPVRKGPAVLMWSGSRNSIVQGNLFINCERAIVFGLDPQPEFPNSHSGGLIYNNIIYRTEPINADAGISIWDSPGTRVYHNTVIQNGTYPAAIEYRFPSTTGVEIVNNLTDGVILQRDNASGVVSNNYTQASAGMFVNAAAADLHLAPSAIAAIDQAVTIGSILDDFDGDGRPSGVASDLGADERAVVTGEPTSGVPGTLRAEVTERTVLLSWTRQSAGETEYIVERASAWRGEYQVIARLPPDASSYADAGVERGVYRYRVRAFSANTGQFSPYSNTVILGVR